MGRSFRKGVAPAVLGRLEALETVAELNLTPEYEVRLRNKLASLNDKQIQDLLRDGQTVLRRCIVHGFATFGLLFENHLDDSKFPLILTANQRNKRLIKSSLRSNTKA